MTTTTEERRTTAIAIGFGSLGVSSGVADRIAMAMGILASLLALTVLVGWFIDSRPLVQIIPGFAPMQANTALGFLLCGLALIALASGREVAASALGVGIAALGGLTLLQIIAGIDLGIDRLVVQDPFVTDRTSAPGRMSPLTALSFTLLAASVLLARSRGLLTIFPLLPSFVVTAIAASILLTYALGADSRLLVGAQTEMAIHTAVGFVGVGAAGVVVAVGRATAAVRQSALVPIIVGLIGTAASAAGWLALEGQTLSNLEEFVEREVPDLASDITRSIEPHVRSLERQAARWRGDDGSVTAWIADSERYVGDIEGLHVVARIGSDLTIRYVAPSEGNSNLIGSSAGDNAGLLQTVRKARETGETVLSTGLQLFNSADSFTIVAPTTSGGRFDGAILGVAGLKLTLDHGLASDGTLGFGVRVLEGGREIYRTPGGLTGRRDLTRTVDIAIRNLDWTVEVWPRDEVVDALKSNLPSLMALLAFFMSGLMTVAAYLWQISARHATELEAARRDLLRRAEVQDDLNQTLARRTWQLSAANKELEAFSYSVSHDLRAPLRAMSGFSNALLEDYGERLDATAKQYLDRIVTASQRMDTLIDGLLGLSRISRKPVKRHDIDMSEVAASLVGELEDADPGRVVDVTISPGLTASADQTLMRVALQNLIGNAWKFSAKADRARVGVGAEDHDGERVYFVRDNGAGFDMAYADKLFHPFQRLHAVADYPGTGIGLATVARIIAKHGGRIWVDAAPDRGATFYFTLGDDRGGDSPDDAIPTSKGVPSAPGKDTAR